MDKKKKKIQICKCSECGRKFEMPEEFSGTILCEDCDGFMNPLSKMPSKIKEKILEVLQEVYRAGDEGEPEESAVPSALTAIAKLLKSQEKQSRCNWNHRQAQMKTKQKLVKEFEKKFLPRLNSLEIMYQSHGGGPWEEEGIVEWLEKALDIMREETLKEIEKYMIPVFGKDGKPFSREILNDDWDKLK